MATLTVASTSRTGLDMAGVTPGGSGDEWLNTGVEMIQVYNGSVASINVTLDIKSTVDGAAVTDPVVAVAAGATKIMGPFPPAYYTDSSTGLAKATCSATATITIKAFKPGPTS